MTGCRFHVTYWLVRDGEVDGRTVADLDYHLRYRFVCACGREGPPRSSENTAAEDGCDHAYPGWRTMPVMRERPYEGKPLRRWEEDARRVYLAGWFERGGPVREYRRPGLTRHVPGYAPGGGYCMAVMRVYEPHQPPAVPHPECFVPTSAAGRVATPGLQEALF